MTDGSPPHKAPFVEGVHFYFENGLMVLTAKYLLDRGYCCGNGCRHCPYGEGQSQNKDETPQGHVSSPRRGDGL